MTRGRRRVTSRTDPAPIVGYGFTILCLLTEAGRLESGELTDLLDRRQNDLYHHLAALEEAGLVGKSRDGGSREYELSPLAETFVPRSFEAIGERADAV